MKNVILFLLAVCLAGCSDVASSLTDGAANDSTLSDAGTTSFPSIDDLASCDPVQPNFDCITKLFVPLDGADWPFDAGRVAAAFRHHETYVSSEFRLTALHVLEANSPFPFRCFFEDFRFAPEGETIHGPGCGELVFAGGHSHAVECMRDFVPMARCVDQVSVSEAFDIALVRADVSEAWLDPWTILPAVGDRVFLVGSPTFDWLTEDQRRALEPLYPLVSTGRVLARGGRGIVTSNLAFAGASGGALIDERSEMLGVAFTLVRHMREQGTFVSEALEDHREVSVFLDERMKQGILAARQL